MMKKIAILWGALMMATTLSAQNAAQQVLSTTQKVNDYFMAKYADPTLPTNVKKVRPSNLWTRAVYYEGLMALNEIDPQPRYMDYTDRWAEFHQWTPRNGVKTCDADDQCCEQTYLMRYEVNKNEKILSTTLENLDQQMQRANPKN